MFVLFIILVVGPVIAKKFIEIPQIDVMDLQQPSNWMNNDTSAEETGTAVNGGNDAQETDSPGGGNNNNNRMMARALFGIDI